MARVCIIGDILHSAHVSPVIKDLVRLSVRLLVRPVSEHKPIIYWLCKMCSKIRLSLEGNWMNSLRVSTWNNQQRKDLSLNCLESAFTWQHLPENMLDPAPISFTEPT